MFYCIEICSRFGFFNTRNQSTKLFKQRWIIYDSSYYVSEKNHDILFKLINELQYCAVRFYKHLLINCRSFIKLTGGYLIFGIIE